MSLTLYFHPLSSFCQKALVALYENDTPFEPHIVNLMDEAERAALKKLWPVGKFPVLRDEARDRTIPESSIIIEYLAQHYPGGTKLVPGRADARPPDAPARPLLRPLRERADAEDRDRPAAAGGRNDPHGVAEAKALLKTSLDMIERGDGDGTWAMGEAFTMADCAAAPALFYANMVMPFGDTHQNAAAYLDRLMAASVLCAGAQGSEPYLAFFPK